MAWYIVRGQLVLDTRDIEVKAKNIYEAERLASVLSKEGLEENPLFDRLKYETFSVQITKK